MLRQGKEYDYDRLMQQSVERYIPFMKLFFEKNKEKLTQKDVNDFAKRLICSTIISMAYVYGANITFNELNPLDVWPADILTSDKMVPVLRYERG